MNLIISIKLYKINIIFNVLNGTISKNFIDEIKSYNYNIT